MKISIIGGGVSGTLTLQYIIDNIVSLNVSLSKISEIILYDYKDRFGKGGVAFADSCDFHITNTTANQHEGLIEWMKLNGYGVEVDGFVKRLTIGKYVNYLHTETLAKAQKYNITITHINQRAQKAILDDNANIAQILDEAGVIRDTNHTIVATGNYICTPYNHISNIVKPYLDDVENIVKENSKVMVIGSGLTAVDMILLLNKKYNAQTFITSPSGKFQALTSKVLKDNIFLTLKNIKAKKPLSFKYLVRLFAKDVVRKIKEYDFCVSDARVATIKFIRLNLNEIWLLMPREDRIEFMDKYWKIWNYYRHTLPRHIMEKINIMKEQGKLETLPNNIIDIEFNKEKKQYVVEFQDGYVGVFDNIISATGPQPLNNPFISNLISKKIIKQDQFGKIECNKDGFVKRANSNDIIGSISFVGPVASSVETLESCAYFDINQNAKLLAKALIKNIMDKES